MFILIFAEQFLCLLFSNAVQQIALKDVRDFHHFLGNFIWKF